MSNTQNHNPKITLLTACLNSEKTIERTLKSIEMQEYPNLEYIVIDGGSTDATLAIIQKYNHLTTRIISEKDKNIADAYNKGFRVATGDIFCWLNADDEFTPNALKRVADFFSTHPKADVLTGGCLRVFADKTTQTTQVSARFLETMALKNNLEQPSTFWRAQAHRQAGVLDDSFFLVFDWEWWNRLHTIGAKFHAANQVLSVYHFTDDNLTSRGGLKVVNEMHRITKMYGPRGVANAYRFLFKYFDMRGYYDIRASALPRWKNFFFQMTLKILRTLFGKEAIDSYNWNWASKQIRGIVWYK